MINYIYKKIIFLLGLIVILWLVLKWLYPLPIVFWHGAIKSGKSPLPQGFTLDFKLKFLNSSSLIVAACGRNIESHIFEFRDRMQNITSLFGEHHIFIGESDSSDNTLKYLRQWAKENDRVTIRTYGNLSHNMAMRAVRIAYCRNDLLDEIRRIGHFRSPRRTFYMAVDPDINKRLNQPNFLSNFDYSIDEWGVMTASRYGDYYDIWALRNDVINYDCLDIQNNHLVNIATFGKTFWTHLAVHMKTIPSNHSLIRMNSAFGGAAIYQIEYLNGCRYSGYESFEICEHVPFNLCVTHNKGKIFINPKFQTD